MNNQSNIEHLSYCSNIHAGESWPEIEQNIISHIPSVRSKLQHDAEFGIGLRLSAAAVEQLSQPGAIAKFAHHLNENQLYVFTINAFPYGPFHGTRVKEDVYLPDWKDPERLRYTNRVATTFSELIQASAHAEPSGSISTVPGAFKACVENANDIELMRLHFVEHVIHLIDIEQKTGININLAIEPEPCCFLETIEETVDFFSNHLFSTLSESQLQKALNLTVQEAKAKLRQHLTVCLDLCHAAVEFEDAKACLSKLKSAQISVGKMQISSGLRMQNVNKSSAVALEPFIDTVYLHQVVEKHQGTINRYIDLPQALATLDDQPSDKEWRIHFHVPIFIEQFETFSSTQFFIREILALHKQKSISPHLEVETYTWDVLPDTVKTDTIDVAIARELHWVQEQLA